MFMQRQLHAERRPLARRRRRIVSEDQPDKIRLLTQVMKKAGQNMCWRYLRGHQSCVNAIEFGRGNLFASAGDDKRVLLWQIEDFVRQSEKACIPVCMQTTHEGSVFTLSFNCDGSALASAGEDANIIIHNTSSLTQIRSFKQQHAVLGVDFHPESPNVFLTADVDGCIRLIDSRDDFLINNDGKSAGIPLAKHDPCFHSVQFRPRDTRYFLTAHMDGGVALWDMRNAQTCVARYGGEIGEWECLCARFNAKGDRIVMLKRAYDGYALQVFNTNKPDLPLFRLGDPRYSNDTAAVKSCCFAGADDEYVCAGGDKSANYGVYMWHLPRNQTEIDADQFIATEDMQNAMIATAFDFDVQSTVPEEVAKRVVNRLLQIKRAETYAPVLATKLCAFKLGGYRSITNQVRFDRERMLLATCGVENAVKIWSPLPLLDNSDKFEDDGKRGDIYSMIDMLGIFQSSNLQCMLSSTFRAIAHGIACHQRANRDDNAANVTAYIADAEPHSDERETDSAEETDSPVLSPAIVAAERQTMRSPPQVRDTSTDERALVPGNCSFTLPAHADSSTSQTNETGEEYCPTSTAEPNDAANESSPSGAAESNVQTIAFQNLKT